MDNILDQQPKKEGRTLIVLLYILGLLILLSLAAYFILSQYNLPPASENQEKAGEEKKASFSALTSPKAPPFIENIRTNNFVKIDFHYDGDYISERDYFNTNYDYYIPPGTDEKFIPLPKEKNREDFSYGSPLNFSIFKSQESHSYQGTPVYILNPYDKSSLAYIGLNIDDANLISELKIEAGIDYNVQYWSMKKSFISSLLGIEEALACGPGIYLRKIGESALDFVQEKDGVRWYKLRNPIALYNLRLTYSDYDCSAKPNYCQNQADDPSECDKYFSCFYNASIKDLSQGNLRMHIKYNPNDKEGLLRVQVANIILSDISGAFSQATMGEGFGHYYRAYLH